MLVTTGPHSSLGARGRSQVLKEIISPLPCKQQCNPQAVRLCWGFRVAAPCTEQHPPATTNCSPHPDGKCLVCGLAPSPSVCRKAAASPGHRPGPCWVGHRAKRWRKTLSLPTVRGSDPMFLFCQRRAVWQAFCFSSQRSLLLSFKKHTESDKSQFKVVKADAGSLPELHGQLQPYFVLLCVYVRGSRLWFHEHRVFVWGITYGWPNASENICSECSNNQKTNKVPRYTPSSIEMV